MKEPEKNPKLHDPSNSPLAPVFDAHAQAINRFAGNMLRKGRSPAEWCIVIFNVNDPIGAEVAEKLMPGNDAEWEMRRAMGQVPYARGIAERAPMEELCTLCNPEVGRLFKREAGIVVFCIDTAGVGIMPVYTKAGSA